MNLHDLKPKCLVRAEGFKAAIMHMWTVEVFKAKDMSTSATAFWLTYCDKGCLKAPKHMP